MSFPDVSEAFWGWDQAIKFMLVVDAVTDYEATETPVGEVWFNGVLEPVPETKLLVKPEGQRTWKWWYLYTKYALELGQTVRDEAGSEYRVMQVVDWSRGSHRQYQLVQDPPAEATP